MTDVFVAYSSIDKEAAAKVANAFELLGLTVYLDKHRLVSGDFFPTELNTALNEATCAVVLWSDAAAKSEYVIAEAERARTQKKYFPAQISNFLSDALPPPLWAKQRPDLGEFLRIDMPEALSNLGFLTVVRALSPMLRRPGLEQLTKALASPDNSFRLHQARLFKDDPLGQRILQSERKRREEEFRTGQAVRETTAKQYIDSASQASQELLNKYQGEIRSWLEACETVFGAWIENFDTDYDEEDPAFPAPPLPFAEQQILKQNAEIEAARLSGIAARKDLEKKLSESEDQLQRARLDLAQRSEAGSRLEAELASKRAESDALSRDNIELRRTADDAKRSRDAATAQASELTAQRDGLQRQCDILAEQLKTASAHNGTPAPSETAALSELKQSNENLASELASAKLKLAAAEGQLEKAAWDQDDVRRQREVAQRAQGEVAEMRVKLSETETKLIEALRKLAESSKPAPQSQPRNWFGVLLAVVALGGAGVWAANKSGLMGLDKNDAVKPPVTPKPHPSDGDEDDWRSPAKEPYDIFANEKSGDAAVPTFTPPSGSQPEPPPTRPTPTQPSPGTGPKALGSDCDDCPTMMRIPEGQLPNGERVPAFAMSAMEVTRRNYAQFFKNSEGHKFDQGCLFRQGDDRPDRDQFGEAENGWITNRDVAFDSLPEDLKYLPMPVVCVTHRDATAYAKWLSAKTGLPGFALPTPEQWEFAARAGDTRDRPWPENCDGTGPDCNICKAANMFDQSANNQGLSLPDTGKTKVRCQDGGIRLRYADYQLPNALGLRNMIGNAAEYTSNCIGPSETLLGFKNELAEAVCPTRGGSWIAPFEDAAYAWQRRRTPESLGTETVGFRVVRPLKPDE
jgi:formylglycine-generating enzyme required for sulfatase activity